jgi:hypothetical protein
MCVCLFVCVNLYGCNTVTFLECLEAATAFRDCAESMLPCCDPGLSISALPLLLQRRHAESDMGTKRFKECLCVWLSVGFMKVFSVSSELLSDCIPRCIDLPLWSSVSSSSALLTRTIHGIAYVPTRYWLQFEPGKCKPRTSQLITLTEPLLGYIMGRYEKHWETIENMEEKVVWLVWLWPADSTRRTSPPHVSTPLFHLLPCPPGPLALPRKPVPGNARDPVQAVAKVDMCQSTARVVLKIRFLHMLWCAFSGCQSGGHDLARFGWSCIQTVSVLSALLDTLNSREGRIDLTSFTHTQLCLRCFGPDGPPTTIYTWHARVYSTPSDPVMPPQ